MSRLTMVSVLVIQGLVTSLALAQPAGASKPEEEAPRSGYKVAFWYDHARPIQSFQYQVYDLAKGQYDHQAVSHWLDIIKSKFPGHTAYVKDILPVRESGKDEHAALMAAIEREKQKVGEMMGRTGSENQPVPSQERNRPTMTSDVTRPTDFGSLMHPSISGYSRSRSNGRTSLGRLFSGSSRYDYAPSTPSFPFPYPYPRPHP